MVYKPKYDYLNEETSLKEEVQKHEQNTSLLYSQTADRALIELNFNRADNELKHAEAIFRISNDSELKKKLELMNDDTFYSGAIAHAYYAIFFAAKALLLTAKIITKSPNIHKATLDAFAYHFTINGRLDLSLLKIYKSTAIKADSLLGLFVSEKEKRGEFTYQTLPDANRLPASESIENATIFLTQIKKVIDARK